MQKYGKVFMAVVGAVLMVGYALPSFRGGSMTGNTRIVGTVEGEKITSQDVYRAQQAWSLLKQLHLDRADRSIVEILGPSAVQQINNRPILFLLLQKEAQKMGVTVSMDQLNSIIENTPSFKTRRSRTETKTSASPSPSSSWSARRSSAPPAPLRSASR